MQSLNDEVLDRPEMSEINVTPFIDVMLVLLIIFMATMPLATANMPIDLPAVSTQVQKNKGQPVILSLDKQGSLFLGKKNIVFQSIDAELAVATHGNKDTVIFFQIDKEVKYDLVMKMMNELRQAGYLKVGLVGMPKLSNK